MPDLSQFQRGQIIGARMKGASVSKIIEIFVISSSNVSKEMAVSDKKGKISLSKIFRKET